MFSLNTLPEACKAINMLSPVSSHALIGHALDISLVEREDMCQIQCALHRYCLSYNFGPPSKGKHVCELFNTDAIQQPHALVPLEGYTYQGTKVY